MKILRTDKIEGLKHGGPLYTWSKGESHLCLDAVEYEGKKGVILCYHNPPVHQVGNPGLDAYLEAIEVIAKHRGKTSFLILYGSNDPVHAGGDLKESLSNLDKTLALKKELEARGASTEEIDQLYEWGDKRLEKGFAVYRGIRSLAQDLRIIAICGGGTRYGGSAEIPLMADYIVGDSRSGMCFSEAMIGLIPGWSGVGRAVTKAGLINAKYLAETGAEVKAALLQAMGIYTIVVEVPFPFPKKETTGDPERDTARYQEALQNHNDETGFLLLPKALGLAVCPESEISRVHEDERFIIVSPEALSGEVGRRSNPYTYEGLWEKPLKEVREQLTTLGRPLAPQSIQALEDLFAQFDISRFDEEAFVEAAMKADARLYRHPRFRAGIVATLEQKVADFREVRELREKELTEAKENMLVIAEHDKRRNL